MNYRQATLLATKQITTAGTEPVDIDSKDLISRITIILELINNGNNPTNHPVAAISQIDVVDGATVIASMSGYAAQAMAYYDTGRMPHNELNYEDNAYARVTIPLNFGRWLYDERYALDPLKFKNLQIRITHNYALGGSSPDNAYLRVLADFFDEKTAAPVGYMLNREIFSYTPAAGSAKYIDLPTDVPIRKILVMNTNDNEEPDIQFETLKVDEDDGKRVLIDCYTMDIIRAVSQSFPQFQEYFSGHLAATTDDEFWLTASKDLQFSLVGQTAGTTFHMTWSGGRARVFQASAADLFGAIVSGRCPHGAVPLFFGQQDKEDDWWDVTRIGKARLIATPRSSSCDTEKTTNIIVQQAKLY